MSQVILDEQIRLRLVLESLRSWTTVRRLIELRPRSVIKDEAISSLLQRAKQATFVTINVGDFWKRKLCDRRYCIVCMALPDERQGEISHLLRRLFHLPEFKTRAARMGKVVHVTLSHVRYYQFGDERLHVIPWATK